MTDQAGTHHAEERPLVLLHTSPQPVQRIFGRPAWERLHRQFRVLDVDGDPASLDRELPQAFAVVGQPDLPASRVESAERLRLIVNVEGNFYPNVDYAAAFRRGIRVLGCGPAYAQAVAEYALALALDLARGITREDRAFRAGAERYLGEGNQDAVLLRGADVGFIGFGNLGRALLPLLEPFRPDVAAFDPWLPEAILLEAGVRPASLEEALDRDFVFVLAAVTDANHKLLDAGRLATVRRGARLILVSRAAITDYDALVQGVRNGDFVAAVDVWPDEPVPADHPARSLEGMILSAHRAGGIPAAFRTIGDMVVDDLALVAAGLPPARMQVAAPELVTRYRNKPAGA